MIEGDVTEAKMAEHGAAPDGGDEIGAMPWDSHILEVDELTALIVTLAKPDQPLEELTTVVQRTGTIVSTLWEGMGIAAATHGEGWGGRWWGSGVQAALEVRTAVPRKTDYESFAVQPSMPAHFCCVAPRKMIDGMRRNKPPDAPRAFVAWWKAHMEGWVVSYIA